MNDFKYSGQELEIFSIAQNWKSYWSSKIATYMGDSILEVGAGIGSNTKLLLNNKYKRWVCMEPDADLAHSLASSLLINENLPHYKVINSTLKELSVDIKFDTILYLDVLEHIDDDKGELERAKKYLYQGGTIIILAPAHTWLFSEFDKAIGHYRRYSKGTLKNMLPDKMEFLKLEYLDSVGLIASICNRHILKNQIPSQKQIKIWDSLMIPCSRIIDTLTNYRLGKSLLGIFRYT